MCNCESGNHHGKHSCCCGGHHGKRSCGCGGHHDGHPIFWTKEAKISWLENYLTSLEKETKSVQNRLDELVTKV